MDNKPKNNEIKATGMIDEVNQTFDGLIKESEKIIGPVRQNAFKRFPTLFILMTTFGVSAVLFSFERLLTEWTYLYERPWLILLLGIMILVFTGRLYKKLG